MRAVAEGTAEPKASDLRLPLQIEGAWQVRLHFDQNDMPVRHYQLVANRWRATPSGKTASAA